LEAAKALETNSELAGKIGTSARMRILPVRKSQDRFGCLALQKPYRTPRAKLFDYTGNDVAIKLLSHWRDGRSGNAG
jgi:hypothetical protein